MRAARAPVRLNTAQLLQSHAVADGSRTRGVPNFSEQSGDGTGLAVPVGMSIATLRFMVLNVLCSVSACGSNSGAGGASQCRLSEYDAAADCGRDSGSEDATGPRLSESDAAAACVCGDQGELSLECFCAQFRCPTLAEARTDVFCQEGHPSPSGIIRGCGQIVVSHSAGLGSLSWVYDEASHELLGAQRGDDVPDSRCNEFNLGAGLPPTDCKNTTSCSLCASEGELVCLPE